MVVVGGLEDRGTSVIYIRENISPRAEIFVGVSHILGLGICTVVG